MAFRRSIMTQLLVKEMGDLSVSMESDSDKRRDNKQSFLKSASSCSSVVPKSLGRLTAILLSNSNECELTWRFLFLCCQHGQKALTAQAASQS
ncbi:Tyrosine-Protein Kinase Receptor Ufo [Manis pentadactyla]|nr:Tyrosine-Protein Kinase Receptor Ufo [Manis pentadactyla]